jgi:putative addiction module component (TIGR02574 family)
MSTDTASVFEAALSLPTEHRAALAERLLESLDPVSEQERAEIDQAWAEEAEERIQAYRQGRIKTIPGDDVLHSLRSRRAGES